MHPAKGGNQVLKETKRDTAHQRLHKPDIQGVPGIKDSEEWCKKLHSDPVADG